MQIKLLYRSDKIGILWFLCLASLVIFWFGCGKKAPPVPPSEKPPPAVGDLSAVLEGETVRLTWSIPQGMEKEISDVSGVIVCRWKIPLSDPYCPGCPVQCERAADLAVKRDESGKIENRMAYTETLEKGYRYTYTVNVYSKSGGKSNDSNRVTFSF